MTDNNIYNILQDNVKPQRRDRAQFRRFWVWIESSVTSGELLLGIPFYINAPSVSVQFILLIKILYMFLYVSVNSAPWGLLLNTPAPSGQEDVLLRSCYTEHHMLTCTCRTQSSGCSSVIYEVMSMTMEQRRELNVSLCVKLLQSAARSLLPAQTLLLTLIVIWLNLTGLPWIRQWTGSSCLTQISVPGQRWTTSQSECWGHNDSLFVLFTGCRSSICMIPHRLSLLCVIDNIILSRQKCDLHCEQFTVRFRLLTCEAAAFVTVRPNKLIISAEWLIHVFIIWKTSTVLWNIFISLFMNV